MEVIKEGVKAQEYQYEALVYIAVGLGKTLKQYGLNFEYHMPDPIAPDRDNGDPDFCQLGWGAACSTLYALELSNTSNGEK